MRDVAEIAARVAELYARFRQTEQHLSLEAASSLRGELTALLWVLRAIAWSPAGDGTVETAPPRTLPLDPEQPTQPTLIQAVNVREVGLEDYVLLGVPASLRPPLGPTEPWSAFLSRQHLHQLVRAAERHLDGPPDRPARSRSEVTGHVVAVR